MENTEDKKLKIIKGQSGDKLGTYDSVKRTVKDIQGRIAENISDYEEALYVMTIEWSWKTA